MGTYTRGSQLEPQYNENQTDSVQIDLYIFKSFNFFFFFFMFYPAGVRLNPRL